MKKIIFLAVALATIMVGCHEREVKEEKVGTELKLFLEECLSKVPNAKDNKYTRQEFEDTIKARMEKMIGDTLRIIHNYPMTISTQIKCNSTQDVDSTVVRNLNKYLVVFRDRFLWNLDESDKLQNGGFQVITFLDFESVKSLKDDGIYKIQGRFKGFADGFRIPGNGGVLTDQPSVSSSDNEIRLTLGTMILEDVKIEPFEEDNM
ncbi:MAG: hypothetical protein Q3992_06425 [Bacteroides sp.]|nr:hypothetical protein [Bacteroides sp.]